MKPSFFCTDRNDSWFRQLKASRLKVHQEAPETLRHPIVQPAAGCHAVLGGPENASTDLFQRLDQVHIFMARHWAKSPGRAICLRADAQVGSVNMPMALPMLVPTGKGFSQRTVPRAIPVSDMHGSTNRIGR